jgi:TPR repeat protein
VPAALREYQAQNYAIAYAGFFESAMLGHGAAQYNLALMAWRGHGLPRNPDAALGWLLAAASNGYSVEPALLAEVRGQVTARGQVRTDDIYKRYARAALEESLLPDFERACTRWQRVVPLKNISPVRSREWKAREGLLLFEFLLGVDGIPRDVEILVAQPGGLYNYSGTRALLKSRFQPARCGEQLCETRTYHRYIYTFHPGMGLRPQDEARLDDTPDAMAKLWGSGAIDEAREGAREQLPSAQFRLGMAALADERLRIATPDALRLILSAAQGGNVEAQAWIGRHLYESCGDGNRSVTWLEVASRNGSDDARVLLARILLKGASPAEIARARELLMAVAPTAKTRTLKYAAALLATSPVDGLRDPVRALALATSMDVRRTNLDPQEIEVHAAALAANHRFKGARRRQREAIHAAWELGWNTSAMEERSETYSKLRPWTGDLFHVPPAQP